jgi:hypothetical protein
LLLAIALMGCPRPGTVSDIDPMSIEGVCDYSMSRTIEEHGDQFVAEAREQIKDQDEMAWLLDATRAQWRAELNRQCIETLIPMRRDLVQAGIGPAFEDFADCIQTTPDLESMEACFQMLRQRMTSTPVGSASRAVEQVNQIRDALLTYGVIEGSYIPVPAFVPDENPGSEPRPWPEGSPFQIINWAPEDGMAWGSYRIELVGEDDFKITGMMDIDGDGVPAIWTATKMLEATQQTDPSIH